MRYSFVRALTLAVAALGFASSSAMAVEDIINTKHNLSTTASTAARTYFATGGTGADEVCVFCHTPHEGNTTVGVVLWNRTTDNTGYTMYSSSTIDMTIDPAPTDVSLACLSCHDGIIAFDALLNAPGSGDGPPVGWTFNGGLTTLAGSGVTEIGKDLSNDHPISVTYDNTADTAFNAPASFTNVRLYSGKVQCASCHNPHEATVPTFLRASNAGSALCLECHIK